VQWLNADNSGQGYLLLLCVTMLTISRAGTVLIVCPASVLYNWVHELTVWGFFEVGTYHGSHKDQTAEALADDRLDVVLTTYGTLVKTPSLQRYGWMLVVLDECHRIKSGTSQTAKVWTLHCCHTTCWPTGICTLVDFLLLTIWTQACDAIATRHRLGLSGTIFQNEFKEMWTVLHWARPGCLGTVKVSWVLRKLRRGFKLQRAYFTGYCLRRNLRPSSRRLLYKVIEPALMWMRSKPAWRQAVSSCGEWHL
jgi:SNF2 family DNA or RNA helicase